MGSITDPPTFLNVRRVCIIQTSRVSQI